MDEAKRKRRDFIQNLTIALLSVLAVLLFTQSQRFVMRLDGAAPSDLLSGPDAPIGTVPLEQDTPLTLPVRIAVTGPYGRYGNTAVSTADESFLPFRQLLEQALNSASAPTLCSAAIFEDELRSPSLYCDFLSPLPLSVLANAVWTSNELPFRARYLLLSGQDETAALYLWDGGSTCYRCSISLPLQELETAVNQYESGNTHFALDLTESAQALAPFSLLPDAVPAIPVLSASASLSGTDRLLTQMDFNPNTNYRYPESDGSETVVEGDRSLRIRPNGIVVYSSGEESVLTIEAQGEHPTLLEAALGANALLNELLAGTSGEAKLYLTEIQQTGSVSTLCFNYQAGGIPIRFSNGQNAAEVTLEGAVVSDITLRFRQYVSAGTNSLLLPLTQALAIAAQQPGQELSIGYVDNGSDSVSAGWLSDETEP